MVRRLGVLVLLMRNDVRSGAGAGRLPWIARRRRGTGVAVDVGDGNSAEHGRLSAEHAEQGESRGASSFEKKNPDADAATLKKLDEIFDSTPLFSFDDIPEAVIPAYQKNLSAADVQAGIDFYTSDAGKRLLEKLPVIMREANESGGQLVQQKLAGV